MTAAAGTLYRLTILLPPKGISPNARVHWSKRSALTAQYKTECWARAHNAILRGQLPKFDVPVVIDQEWFLGPTGLDKRERPRDEDNMRACLKAALDGLTQARVIPDDSRKWVSWGSFAAHSVAREHKGRAEIVLTFWIREPG